jgi:FAD:protein FMN transferase
VAVSVAMMNILLCGKKIWKQTDQLIDPSIGQAVIAAGYDDSFERLSRNSAGRPKIHSATLTSFENIKLDTKNNTVFLPPESSLDFGGIGKGYVLDQLAPLISKVTKNFWLSLGGDLLVSGVDDAGQPWPVGIQDPKAHERDSATLRLPKGVWGVATSGTTKRHGVRNGVAWHHLIDPRTNKPAATDVLGATVIAPTALEADAMAKVVLIRGSKDGIAWATKHHIEALAITDAGQMIPTAHINQYLAIT